MAPLLPREPCARPFRSRTPSESDYTLIIYRVISDVCTEQLLENESLN